MFNTAKFSQIIAGMNNDNFSVLGNAMNIADSIAEITLSAVNINKTW